MEEVLDDHEEDGIIGAPPLDSNIDLLVETAPPHSLVGSPHAAVGLMEEEEFDANFSRSTRFWVTVWEGIATLGSPQDCVGAGGGIIES